MCSLRSPHLSPPHCFPNCLPPPCLLLLAETQGHLELLSWGPGAQGGAFPVSGNLFALGLIALLGPILIHIYVIRVFLVHGGSTCKLSLQPADEAKQRVVFITETKQSWNWVVQSAAVPASLHAWFWGLFIHPGSLKNVSALSGGLLFPSFLTQTNQESLGYLDSS